MQKLPAGRIVQALFFICFSIALSGLLVTLPSEGKSLSPRRARANAKNVATGQAKAARHHKMTTGK